MTGAPDRGVARVLRAFGLVPESVVPSAAGNVNDSWFVDAGGRRFVLRRYSTARIPAGIPFEHEVLRALAATGWPVAAPHAAPDGSTLVKVAGRFHALFPFLPGGRLDDPARHGAVLARLHAATAQLHLAARPTWPRLAEYGRRPFGEALAAFAPVDPNRAAGLLRHHGLVGADLARLGTDGAASLPVHGDFHTGNLLWEAGQLTGVLDFDFARVDLRVADLAIALGFLADDREGRLALLAAYEREAPLLPVERQLLSPLRRARELERAAYALRRMQAGAGDQRAEVAACLARLDAALEDPP